MTDASLKGLTEISTVPDNYFIYIVDTAMTERGLQIVFASGLNSLGQSFSVSFDFYSDECTSHFNFLTDIAAAETGEAIPGWQTFIKTLSGNWDYLCEPPFIVSSLTPDDLFEGLNTWLRENVY